MGEAGRRRGLRIDARDVELLAGQAQSVAQIDPGQAAPIEVGLVGVGEFELGPVEDGLAQLAKAQAGPKQLGVLEMGAVEVGPREVGADQVNGLKFGPS